MDRKKLSADEITARLAELGGWSAENDRLVKSFKFQNFAESLEFVNKAGEHAERLDHHPDITLGWGYADFVITTHSAGGITALDFALAREIDMIR